MAIKLRDVLSNQEKEMVETLLRKMKCSSDIHEYKLHKHHVGTLLKTVLLRQKISLNSSMSE